MPLTDPEREFFVAQGVDDTEPKDARLQFIDDNPPGAIVNKLEVWQDFKKHFRKRKKKRAADANNRTTSIRQQRDSSGKAITPSLSSPFPSHIPY